MDLLLRRLLDDLYWVMSYSRWSDQTYWPLFRDEMLKTNATVTSTMLEKAREYNFPRYYYQGIGRYAPEEVYARGLADLSALAEIIPERQLSLWSNAQECGRRALRLHR